MYYKVCQISLSLLRITDYMSKSARLLRGSLNKSQALPKTQAFIIMVISGALEAHQASSAESKLFIHNWDFSDIYL